MKHPTRRTSIACLLVLMLVGCQPETTWKKKFSIESYRLGLADLALYQSIDTLDLRTFEDYLLQHPFSADGRALQELFITSDTVRFDYRKKLITQFSSDTLFFRRRNYLVPDPADPDARDLIFKVFLVNLKSPEVRRIDVLFPTSVYEDSVWVDSVAVFDSLHLAPHDSLELYSYKVDFDEDAYLVGSSRMDEPLLPSQIEPPQFYVNNMKLASHVDGKKVETVLRCSNFDNIISSEKGDKPPEFIQYSETSVVVNIPCLGSNCNFRVEATNAYVYRDYANKKRVYKVMPVDSVFTLSVYTVCIPDCYMESETGIKTSLAGRNLLTEVNLVAKEE